MKFQDLTLEPDQYYTCDVGGQQYVYYVTPSGTLHDASLSLPCSGPRCFLNLSLIKEGNWDLATQTNSKFKVYGQVEHSNQTTWERHHEKIS